MVLQKKEKLRKDFNTARDNYAKAFCEKHEFVLEFDNYWIGECILGVSDYYVNLEDLMYDIDKDIDKGIFFKWYDYSIEQHYKGVPSVNYKSYINGAR
jgi:hypothetical protein